MTDGGSTDPRQREVRARYDAMNLTVYPAYPPAIAGAALNAGTFVPPFKLDRMTWIKPSFLWMMYRCGWATKPGQERVLAISMKRSGFEWALDHSCLSVYDPAIHQDHDHWTLLMQSTPVRVQWDPERSTTLAARPYRAIQIGLSGEAVERYVSDWIVAINDVTDLAQELGQLVRTDPASAIALLPQEKPYELPAHIKARIAAT